MVALPKMKPKEMTPAMWDAFELDWVAGKYTSLDDASKKLGISAARIRTRITKRKLKKAQAIDTYNRKLRDELEKQATNDARILAERIRETREWHYVTANGIGKMAMSEILKAKNAGGTYAAVKNNLSSLVEAMKVLKGVREEKFAVLGLDKENLGEDKDDIPELIVNALTADQIAEMQARGAEPEEDEVPEDEIVDIAQIELVDEESTDDEEDA